MLKKILKDLMRLINIPFKRFSLIASVDYCRRVAVCCLGKEGKCTKSEAFCNLLYFLTRRAKARRVRRED